MQRICIKYLSPSRNFPIKMFWIEEGFSFLNVSNGDTTKEAQCTVVGGFLHLNFTTSTCLISAPRVKNRLVYSMLLQQALEVLKSSLGQGFKRYCHITRGAFSRER